MLNRMPRLTPLFVVALFAITLVSIPLYDLYSNLFSWQFRQPSFVQGGIELLAIALLLFACGFAKGAKWKYFLLIGITEGYLRRHNADLALLLAFLFAESLVGLGYVFFRNCSGYNIPTRFISGASLFALISMGLSLFGAAQAGYLVAFSTLVLALFYATSFRESLLYKLYGAIEHIYSNDHLTRLVFIVLYMCLLMLAAKSVYRINYDEAWYSLRLGEVLNSSGSFYEDLKLLGKWVHQYPKFLEILLFPLQYFESFTVSKIWGVVVFGIGLVAAYEFWGEYRLSPMQKALMSVVLLSVPVVAVDVTSAKADFFAGFVFLLSVLYFLKGVNDRNSGFLLISVGALVLTLAVKLSAAVYVPVFFALYGYAIYRLRGEFGSPTRVHVAMAILFIATFCAVTWRTIAITGVPFVAFADANSAIASLYGLLGMEYKYPYGATTTFAGAARIDSLTLLFKTFLLPTGVRQSFTWISNIAIPFVIMAAVWFLRFRQGKYEALLVAASFFLIVGMIGLMFNNASINGGDGNYYLIPMMVIVVVGATSFKWMPGYALPIALLCSIYAAANLPIAFVSSQSWHAGTRGWDVVFNQAPFDKKRIQNQLVKANGLLDVRDYFTSLDQRKCVAIADSGGDVLFHLGCRLETAASIFGSRPYLNANEETFVRALKEKGVTHLVVQNYFPNSHFGRFCRQLINSGSAKVSKFEFYNVIDIRDIEYDELKKSAALASTPIEAIRLDNLLPHTIKPASVDAVLQTGRVDFNPRRQAIKKYYSATDKVIFIKPDTAIEFLADANQRCIAGVEAYFAKHIHSSGQKLQGGNFTVTISSEGKLLGEEIFRVGSGNHVQGMIQLHDRPTAIKISVKYESDGARLNPNIPAVMVNPRALYCDTEAGENLLRIAKPDMPKDHKPNIHKNRDEPAPLKNITINFKKWGPRTTRKGVVPNVQPNGQAGLWFQLEADPGLGKVQVYFDGEPVATNFRGLGITAGIPAEQFNKPGAKKIVVRQVSTGKDFAVGEFVVIAK